MRGNFDVMDLVLTPHQCGDMRDSFFIKIAKFTTSQMICPLKIYPVSHFIRGGKSGRGELV